MLLMNTLDLKGVAGAVGFTILVALASLRGCPVEAAGAPADETPQATGTETPEELKSRLLDVAGLREVHHEVYAQVGEQDWEARVKPAFIRDITFATIRDNGTLLPDADEIIDWARTHPEAARDLLRRQAGP